MHGTFRQGEMLLVTPVVLGAVVIGDVIVFRKPRPDGSATLVTHRVQARTVERLIARGDNSSSSDLDLVRVEDLVGCVRFAQWNGKTRRVWGGRAGRLWVGYLRLRRRILLLVRWPYRVLRSSGMLRCLWRPHVAQLRLTTEDGPLVKYVHGQRTVARWWPEKGRFWCRKPYDLVIEHPGEEHYR